jgi:branched-chain amino acid transport system ATP-binding protein
MPLFEARGVTKRFGGLTALHGVDFALERGIASIIGQNGAGKTTLFNVFTGLYVPDEGSVTFRGQALLGLRPDQITTLGVCRTFQNIRLFANMTAVENVLVGMNSRITLGLWDVLSHNPRFRRSESDLAARALGLLDRVGLQANANVVARNLPYGDRRRLELARALASEPALLLLDEPTAGMSPAETFATGEIVQTLNAEGVTILAIEHDMSFVRQVARRVTVLHLGRIFAQGTIEQIVADERVAAIYLGHGHA